MLYRANTGRDTLPRRHNFFLRKEQYGSTREQ